MENTMNQTIGIDCCCDHCRSAQSGETEENKKLLLVRLIGGGVLFLFGLFLELGFIPISWTAAALFGEPFKMLSLTLIVCVISYLLVGANVVWSAIKNIVRGKVFDENFLMTLATFGAFAIGEYPEAVAVMLFYQIGEAFESAATNRSKKSISKLMDIRPDYANVKEGDAVRVVSPDNVAINSIIIIKPGERVPLDGIVLDGVSSLDTSALSGESLPRDIAPGNEVLSGSINLNGLLTVKVTKPAGESTVVKILEMVQNAGSKKSHVENFITKFARYYTPVVVVAALLVAVVPPLLISDAEFSEWLHRALVFLVVSCPCALVISIPLAFFGGIGGASKQGILIKGSNYLEALNVVSAVVFDKTGTLTKGVFKVRDVQARGNYQKDDVLFYAAHVENFSKHPLALSIRAAYNKKIDLSQISDVEEIPGCGMKARVQNKIVLAGNTKLLDRYNISRDSAAEAQDNDGVVMYLAIDGALAGFITLADEIKEDSAETIARLKKRNINVIMLSGDTNAQAAAAAQRLGIDAYYAQLLPHEKVEKFEAIAAANKGSGSLVFVGDGINDAPVLARSDVGIAMGALGSDAAIEAADVVLMNDKPASLCAAIDVAEKTHAIVIQNIVFALGVKAALLVLGAMGIASIWAAVFGDVGVAFIAILNSMRNLRVAGGRG